MKSANLYLRIQWLAVLLTTSLIVQAATENLRIMTFNVPKTNIPSEGVNLWENRVAALQAYWQSLDLDILCLQELQTQDLKDYLVGMPDYVMVGCGRNDGKESGEYEPIIYRTDRFFVEDYGFFWLSKTPEKPSKAWDTKCIRMATWAIMRDKRTQARFILTNTHLDHGTDSCREHQITVVKEQMQQLSDAHPGLPMILTGDLNTLSTKKCYTLALNNGPRLRDAWTTAASRVGTGYTVATSKKKIDYILISKEIRSAVAYTDVSEQPNGLKYSDHDPHYADLVWERTDEEEAGALLILAQEALDAIPLYSKGDVPLITDARDASSTCQLSCDAAETIEGQYVRYLTDGKTNTYFHSRYSSMPPNGPHWLQADLRDNPVERFWFSVTRRDSNTGIKDRWQDILITASNDKKTWDYITELHYFGGDELKAYDSEVIELHGLYRFIRFSIMHTPGMRLINGSPMFTASEFQMYNAVEDSSAVRWTDPYLAPLCQIVEQHCDIVRNAMEQGSLNEDMVDSLRRCVDELNLSRTDEGRRDVQRALLDSALLSVGDCLGSAYDAACPYLKEVSNTDSIGSQLWSNTCSDKTGVSLEALIDGDLKTLFQSDETGKKPASEHWLQANLSEPIDRFVFTMQRHRASRFANYMPAELDIYASNETGDNVSWQYVVHIADIQTSKTTQWASPCVVLPASYRYLRFVVRKNALGLVNDAGAVQFNLGEFGIWPLNDDDVTSDYRSNDEIRVACDQLAALQKSYTFLFDERMLTIDEVVALRQALARLAVVRSEHPNVIDPLVKDMVADEVTVRYFRFDGIPVSDDVKGPVIRVTTDMNGNSRARKFFR